MLADLDLERQREVRERLPALANRRAPRHTVAGRYARERSRRPRPRRRARRSTSAALILDAAVRVFARQGFHACRVSDIADEAGVAYGLVYHYFASKDEVLDTLFLERWNVMLELIREVDASRSPVREKLLAIASFIVDSYRHDPDLMKVIIVEVTRAANSFGQTHIERDPPGLRPDRARSSPRPRRTAVFRCRDRSALRRDGLLRSDRAAADRMDLRPAPGRTRSTSSAPSGWSSRPCAGAWSNRLRAMVKNEMVKRLMWSGLLAGLGALASILAHRARGRHLEAPVRRGAARVSAPRRRRRQDKPTAEHRHGDRRGIRTRDAAGPRGDRARQGRGHREGRANSRKRSDRRHRRRGVLLSRSIFALIGCAWLLYYYLPGEQFTYFWGFFAMSALLVVLGVIAGLIAAKSSNAARRRCRAWRSRRRAKSAIRSARPPTALRAAQPRPRPRQRPRRPITRPRPSSRPPRHRRHRASRSSRRRPPPSSRSSRPPSPRRRRARGPGRGGSSCASGRERCAGERARGGRDPGGCARGGRRARCC